MSGGYRIESFDPGDERSAAFGALGTPPSGAASSEPLPAGARCLLAWQDDQPVARLSYLTVDAMQGARGRTGLVGHYEASSAGAGVALLRAAKRILAEAGALRVIGPINGSTWARYRLALPPTNGNGANEPFFLTEPRNPPDYADHFLAASFSAAALYESAVVRDLSVPHPRAGEIGAALHARGITVRPLATDRFAEELAAIFELSTRAFRRNPFYTPIEFATFRAMYDAVRPLLDAELVRLARDAEGRLAGFVFALPDLLTAENGVPGRLVLKTLATAPGLRGLGLGGYLTDEVRRIGQAKGYHAVIHALMHVGNDSGRISRHNAEVFRRYALYRWTP